MKLALRLSVLSLVLVLVPRGFAQQPQSVLRAITIDDFFQIRDVSQPEISPDGQWIAYVVRSKLLKEDKNEQRLWMVSTHGGDAVPMTAEGVSSTHPRWSPDGKYLSFLSARDGGKNQVWLLDRRGGEALRLTDTAQGVDDFEWSPDGTRLVLLLRDPKTEDLEAAKNKEKPTAGVPAKLKTPPPHVIDRLQFKRDTVGYLDRRRAHLYVFDVSSKTTTQVTSGDFEDSDPAWSPDGKSLAFTSNRSQPDPDRNFNTDVWAVAADNSDKGAHPTQITNNPGADHSPAWSPDGKWIAFVSQTDAKAIDYATEHLSIAPSSGGEARVLTAAFDRSVRHPRFSSDGRSIFFIAEDEGTQNLCRIAVTGGEIVRAIGGRLTVSSYSLGKDDSVAVQITSLDRPDEIFFLATNAKDPIRLTKTNDALLSQLRLAQADYVHFKSKDGTPVSGYLYKPLDYAPGKKVPTLLNPHGGPVGQYTASFSHLAQLYAANGYAVLLPNPRGSSGYGQKFCEAIFADWGNKDYQDDMAMVDYAVAQGIADPDKLGVGGWSYGGISTNFIITQTTRFKAAITGASEVLYVANYGHDHYQKLWELELGLPWENRTLYEKLSPFNKVTAITTPTLIMGGEIDWNVPIINSEQLYEALKRLGKAPTELIVYPGEYHGFTMPSHIKDRLERYLAWYAHYVKGDSTPARPAVVETKAAGGE